MSAAQSSVLASQSAALMRLARVSEVTVVDQFARAQPVAALTVLMLACSLLTFLIWMPKRHD